MSTDNQNTAIDTLNPSLIQRISTDWATYFLWFFIALAGLLTWQYINIAIIRNSILYAGITQAISEHGLLSSVEYARNKPLGFAILSWPFTQVYGANIGLKLSSFVWTSLFIWSIFTFTHQLGKHLSQQHGQRQLTLLIAVFNPLIFYQFLSGYADSLFAALFLFSVFFFDKALSKQGRTLDSLLSVGFTLLAIWVKHHGFVLLPIFMGIALLHRHAIQTAWYEKKRHLILLLLSFGFLFILLGLAQTGKLPLFNMGHNVSNFTDGTSRGDIFQKNMSNFGQWILISFGLLLPFIFCWKSYATKPFLWLLLLLFILPILFYKGAIYNIRYFIAITPLFAWIIAEQLMTFKSHTRKYWIIAFLITNGFTIAYYNHIGFNKIVKPHLSLLNIDNLRLTTEQADAQLNLDMIREYATEYPTLIYISRYYGAGTFNIWEKDGLFPKNLNIHYVKKWDKQLIKQFNLEKVLIYQYFKVGERRHSLRKDKRHYSKSKRLSKQLYALNLQTKNKSPNKHSK